MRISKTFCKAVLALALVTPFVAAHAEDDAVAKARMEYEQAMKGHDIGLQNAMKIQLSVQIAKSKAHAEKQAANSTDKSKISVNL